MTRPHKNCDISPSHVDLRDTFAAAALAGYNANTAWDDVDSSIVAEQAYADADAMLRERGSNKTEEPKGPDAVTLSWAWSEACAMLDRGQDPRKAAVPEVWGRCKATLSTNHDAAPAARAEPLERGTRREGQGTGDIPCSRTRDIVARLRKWCHAVDAESAQDLMDEAADEIASLRDAIRRLAAQDATLSVQGGNVKVTMDATLTAEEREAIEEVVAFLEPPFLEQKHPNYIAATLRSLLERMK